MSRIGIIQRSVPTIGLLCVALSGGAQAPARSTSAEIRDIRYEVTFDASLAARRSAKVSTTFSVAGGGRGRVHAEYCWHAETARHARMKKSYEASTYLDVVDRPFIVGRDDLDSAQMSGKWVGDATYPQGAMS